MSKSREDDTASQATEKGNQEQVKHSENQMEGSGRGRDEGKIGRVRD